MFRIIKNLFTLVVIIFAVIGFMSVGGDKYIEELLSKFIDQSKETRMERTRIVGDFTKISDEFDVDKAIRIFGCTAVISEHKASGQKLIILESGKNVLLTESDVSSGDMSRKINDLTKKINYKVKVNDLKITKHGTLYSYGKMVPYAKFEAGVEKLPINEVEGIVSAADDVERGNGRILISISEKGKYSQLIANEFFNKIKVAD